MIRVRLPAHLQQLAGADREVEILVTGPVTQHSLLDALEEQYPVLRGTIRDRVTKERRAYIRFFAGGQDLSLVPADVPLPDKVAAGQERFLIIGAMAGG